MRRRRNRGTWFPNIGQAIDNDLFPNEHVAGRTFGIVLDSHRIETVILPLTFDVPFEGDSVTPDVYNLADILGSEYVLQRIVGKCYMSRLSTIASNGRDGNPAILCAAGFFVARAGDTHTASGENQPIGSTTEAEKRENYSPLETDTIREPWIWRRTWILGNSGAGVVNNPQLGGTSTNAPADLAEVGNYPSSTAHFGSVMDGPHIDSRVKRRISQDDRLWFAVSVTTWPLASPLVFLGNTLLLNGYLDYRIFGSLRKAKNSSAF